jgi:hypothetical protein
MSLAHLKVGRIKFGIVSILICFICAFSSTYAFAQTTLPQQIRIGTRTAAFPIGRVDSTGQISGFCGEAFQDGLRQELLKRGIQSNVSNQRIANQYKGTKSPRYNGLLKQNIEIECGTNSPSSGELLDKTTNKYFKDEITFSKTFYQSGTKLLLKMEQATRLNALSASEQESEIYKLDIGVIQNTTTLKQLQEKGKNFTSYPNREEALDSLDAGRSIEAFATDALIVQTLLEEGVKGDDVEEDRPPYKERGFTLFPLKAGDYLPGLDKADFAIVIKKSTPYARELLSIIDATLDSIQNRNGLAYAEKDYLISNNNGSEVPNQTTTGKPTGSGIDISMPGLFILAIVVVFAILALAKGHNLHQHGSGDNVVGDKIGRDKIRNRNNDSQDEDE